jgi:hypothetical protein
MLEKLYSWQKNINQIAQNAIKESNQEDDSEEQIKALLEANEELKKINIELTERV